MAVALSTLAFIVAIGWWLDRRRQRARIGAVEQQVMALEQQLETLESRQNRVDQQAMALDSRLDRLQGLIEGKRQSWGDSLDLTKFNWRKPGHF